MIQRIQSIYLTLAFACVVLLLIFPLFSVTAISNLADDPAVVSAEFGAYGLVFTDEINSMAASHIQYQAFGDLADEPKSGFFPVYVIFIVMALMTLVSIFLYKKRKKQLMVSRLNLALHVLVLIGVFAFYYLGTAAMKEAMPLTADLTITFTLEIGFYLLVLTVPFLFLAIRGIKNDENLVKSLDRLR